MMFEMVKIGIEVFGFWANGDDQNTLVRLPDVDRSADFINDNFEVSWDKSLLRHELSVWGKLWFSEKHHPMWEIGTFRSIWERERGSNDIVEESKFASNYGKMLQVAITLMRAGVSDCRILDFIESIIDCSDSRIRLDRIPTKLVSSSQIIDTSMKRDGDPVGLRSVKRDVNKIGADLSDLGFRDMYSLLNGIYTKRVIFREEPESIEYYPSGSTLCFRPGMDYGLNRYKDLPYALKNIMPRTSIEIEDRLNADILRSTKSFEGAVNLSFCYNDFMSLAKAINHRNTYAWRRMLNSRSAPTKVMI
jgi:hypothetical protein